MKAIVIVIIGLFSCELWARAHRYVTPTIARLSGREATAKFNSIVDKKMSELRAKGLDSIADKLDSLQSVIDSIRKESIRELNSTIDTVSIKIYGEKSLEVLISPRFIRTGDEVSTKLKAILDKKLSEIEDYDSIQSVIDSIRKESIGELSYIIDTISKEIADEKIREIKAIFDEIFVTGSSFKEESDRLVGEMMSDALEERAHYKIIEIQAIFDKKLSEIEDYDSIQSVIDSIYKESSREIKAFLDNDVSSWGLVKQPKTPLE